MSKINKMLVELALEDKRYEKFEEVELYINKIYQYLKDEKEIITLEDFDLINNFQVELNMKREEFLDAYCVIEILTKEIGKTFQDSSLSYKSEQWLIQINSDHVLSFLSVNDVNPTVAISLLKTNEELVLSNKEKVITIDDLKTLYQE